MEFVLRAGVLLAVLAGAFVAVGLFERRNGTEGTVRLSSGLTLISGPGCRLCEPAAEALRRAGAQVSITEDPALREELRVRSLPTAIVVDDAGQVVMRRSGRSVITDAGALAQAAADLA